MIEPLLEIDNPLVASESGAAFKTNNVNSSNPTDPLDRRTSVRRSHWIKDFAANYDFCIVLPADKGNFTDRGKGYVETLLKLGFDIFAYKNLRDQEEIFLLLRTPLDKLRAFADNLDMPLLLDPLQITSQLAAGDSEKGIGPVTISDNSKVTRYQHNQYIYGKYSRQLGDETLYWHEAGATHPFRELIRLKLCALILESKPHLEKENLKIARYLRNGWMLGVFPLHDRSKTELLEFKMKFYPMQQLPLDDLKEYFGEKITLYFGFTEHYTSWLIAPAIIGLPFQIAVFATGDFSAPFLPFFSVFISLWAVFMLEFWKRKEKTIAMKWGNLGFEDTEVDRPDFRGEPIDSFIDGSPMRYYSSKSRNNMLIQSFAGIITLVILVVGVVVSIYVMRYAISSDVGNSNAQTVASVANAVQIQVMNYIYSLIAFKLADRENHRTHTEYEDSMITKIFLFQFVNSYASFFYLAFIAEWMGDCPADDCMSSLAINLAIIFGSRLATGNLLELVVPYFSYQYKYTKEVLPHGDKITRPEKEYLLDRYDGLSSSLEDYAEVAIQFGYTALFVTALPCSAAFACISSMVEIKGDSWKLLNLHQRPFPKGAEDIGMWQSIFLMITMTAVITNAALTVFTMNLMDAYSVQFNYWVFILFQWVIFIVQAFIMAVIPDIPEEIEIQQKRTEFIVRKLIDKVEDDNTEDVIGKKEALEFKNYPLTGGYYEGGGSHLLTANMK